MNSNTLTLNNLIQNKLSENFYKSNTLAVAKNLLGKIFVKATPSYLITAKIVETEAYTQLDDEAAHSFNGKTERNKVMFNSAGFLYVYFTYGMHFCANVVTGKENEGNAVLIRAVEPLNGIKEIIKNRGNKNFELKNLTNGPAKFCQAFNIKREDNGINLNSNYIFISNSDPVPENKIISTTRIGIKKSVDLPWRFYIKNNKFVSKK